MAELLSIRSVTKIYADKHRGTIHALNGVNLDIAQGEIISLLGVNGAGKTTLSSILATLHPPTSGDVLFKGTSIYKNILDYRRAMGFCPQRPNLDMQLTVKDNLIFAGRYFLLPEVEVKRRVEELLTQFGLDRYASFNIHALSGGYKQRLLIARALMHKPALIILDEPTVGLDPDIRRQLWQVIRQLKQQGITVILTTHYLEEAEILSDRVCMLSRGKIIMTATVQDLKQTRKKNTLEEVFLELVQEDEER